MSPKMFHVEHFSSALKKKGRRKQTIHNLREKSSIGAMSYVIINVQEEHMVSALGCYRVVASDYVCNEEFEVKPKISATKCSTWNI